jgi:thiamine biosynthesis protein ThiS
VKVIVNGEQREVPESTSVEGLIELMGMGSAVCAAEVDKAIVPKRERATTLLREGQRVEIVTLIGGG